MRAKRSAAPALAAVLAVAAAATGPGAAAAADPAAAPAQGTWVAQGAAIHGTATAAGAPAISPGGTYRDTIAAGQTLDYALRLDAGSSDYLSAFAIPPQDSKVGFLDGITLELTAADGKTCDQFDARFRAAGAAAPIGGYVQRQPGAGPLCRQAGGYLLSIRRRSAADSSTAPWGLEIHFAAEPALRGGAGAGPTPGEGSGEGSGSPSDSPAPKTAQPVAVTGAPSLDDAAVLPRSGAYRDRLMPGQSLFYRVPLTWGRQLRIVAEFGRAAVTQAGGFAASGARVDLYNAARGLVEDADTSYDGTPATASVETAPVAYANRFVNDPQVQASPFAGWYYLQVAVHPHVGQFTAGGVEVVLQVQRTGTPTAAAPYRSRPVGFDTAGLAADAPDAAAGQPVPALRQAGYGALGLGALLLAWLAGWAVRARRAPGR